MKKLLYYFLFLSYILVWPFSSQKELSFDNCECYAGSLKSDLTGDCLAKTVAGIYISGKYLKDTIDLLYVKGVGLIYVKGARDGFTKLEPRIISCGKQET